MDNRPELPEEYSKEEQKRFTIAVRVVMLLVAIAQWATDVLKLIRNKN